jgi:hypothetical protein
MLERSDNQADATPFVEFLLEALRSAIEEAVSSDQVTDQVSDQVILLLKSISGKELGSLVGRVEGRNPTVTKMMS